MNWKVLQPAQPANDNAAPGECPECGRVEHSPQQRDEAERERADRLERRANQHKPVTIVLRLPERLRGPNGDCPQPFSLIEQRLHSLEAELNELVETASEGPSLERDVERVLSAVALSARLDAVTIIADERLDNDDLCSLFSSARAALDVLETAHGLTHAEALEALERAIKEARADARYCAVPAADLPRVDRFESWLNEIQSESGRFASAVCGSMDAYIAATNKPVPSVNALAKAMTSKLCLFASNGARSVTDTLSRRGGRARAGIRARLERELSALLVDLATDLRAGVASLDDAMNW